MHVFITGISGFVGGHLARRLREGGDRVSGSYVGQRPEIPECEVYEVDLLSHAAVEGALVAAQPDAIVHLAGLSHVGESWSRMGEYFQVNVLGTEMLVRAAAGVPVVFASSSEVYGPVPDEQQPIGEDRLPDPRTPYALTKAAAERLALAGGAVVVRSFNAVGPGQARSFALPSFAAQLAAIQRGERRPVLKVGNLSAIRDFVHVADAAEAYRLLAHRGETGTVYNLASGRAVSIAQALNRLLEVAGLAGVVRIEQDPERTRPVDVPLLCGDNRRLRALGWEPRRDLDDALEELWEESR